MRFIKYLIEKEYITPAIGRCIEWFIIWIVLALAMGILDNIETLLNGWIVDWKLFFIAFWSTTALAIVSWVRKHMRDLLLKK